MENYGTRWKNLLCFISCLTHRTQIIKQNNLNTIFHLSWNDRVRAVENKVAKNIGFSLSRKPVSQWRFCILYLSCISIAIWIMQILHRRVHMQQNWKEITWNKNMQYALYLTKTNWIFHSLFLRTSMQQMYIK